MGRIISVLTAAAIVAVSLVAGPISWGGEERRIAPAQITSYDGQAEAGEFVADLRISRARVDSEPGGSGWTPAGEGVYWLSVVNADGAAAICSVTAYDIIDPPLSVPGLELPQVAADATLVDSGREAPNLHVRLDINRCLQQVSARVTDQVTLQVWTAVPADGQLPGPGDYLVSERRVDAAGST